MIPKINKLIVLGGPRCVGKSRLMRKCVNLNSHMLNDNFNVHKSHWELLLLNQIEKKHSFKHSNLVLHYDFIRPILRGLDGFGKDLLLPIIEQSEQIEIVTMWCSNLELINRVELRTQLKFNKLVNGGVLLKETRYEDKKLSWVKELYHSTDHIWRIYEEWFEFIDGICANHWVFESSQKREELVRFDALKEKVTFMNNKLNTGKCVTSFHSKSFKELLIK